VVRQREVSREHISVGLIGCGHAAEMHLAAIRSSGRARVVAAADIDKTAVQRVARDGIRPFSDYHGVLAAPEVDTVAVLTPPHVQFEIASAALIAGKHVLIERPMTRSLAEADRLAEQAGSARTALMAGYHLRFHRHIQAARRVIETGAIRAVRVDTGPPRLMR